MAQIDFIPEGFCRVTMLGENFRSESRGKDAIVLTLPEAADDMTHQLRFYDCSYGTIRQLPGKLVEIAEDRLVFQVGSAKKFILESYL